MQGFFFSPHLSQQHSAQLILPSSFFPSILIHELIFFGSTGSLLLSADFLLLWWVRTTLRYGAQASRWSSFSCCEAWALEWGFTSCGHGFSCSTACGLFLDWTRGPCIGRQILIHWTTREAQILPPSWNPFFTWLSRSLIPYPFPHLLFLLSPLKWFLILNSEPES